MRDRFECIDVLKRIWKIEVYLFNDIKFLALNLTKLAEKKHCCLQLYLSNGTNKMLSPTFSTLRRKSWKLRVEYWANVNRQVDLINLLPLAFDKSLI